MARQWRIAVVGVGTVGEWHVRMVPKVPGLVLAAVCDKVEANARKALEKNNHRSVPVYTDAEEMYRKEQIDAVHVCTPSGDHLDPAVAAMRHGKHVVVEKPLEITTERVDQLIEASKTHNVRLAGIFQNRWNEANRVIKKAVDEGRFGRIAWAGSLTPWYRTDKYYEDGGWRGTWKLDGGGAVMNQGVHQVDLTQWIAGPVKTVSAYASSRIHAKIEVEDTLSCALEFASGAYGTFMSSTAMFPGMGTRFEIGGEFGSAVSENGLSHFRFQKERPEDKTLLERLNPHQNKSSGGGSSATDVALDLHGLNIQSIYTAWERGEEAETNGVEARKAVAIIQAMYESARQRGVPVDVK